MQRTTLDFQVMAWVSDRDDGWVMFAHDSFGGQTAKDELEQWSRHLDDFLDLNKDLKSSEAYPAFLVWEGSVDFVSDDHEVDYCTNGRWRRATAREIISAAQGKCPFTQSSQQEPTHA
jgi:hypothetical protein